MSHEITTVYTCDRCGNKYPDNEVSSGYVSFGPINGATSDHVGSRVQKERHADVCPECLKALLSWWRVGSVKTDHEV